MAEKNSNGCWKSEKDVLESWDQISVFSKGQPYVANLKIHSDKHEEKMKIKEAKRLEAEFLQKQKERLEREKEKLKEDRLIEEELRSQEQSKVFIPSIGRGRAQLIHNIRKKLVDSSCQERGNYIRNQVRKTTGYYGNDMIERYWNNTEDSSTEETRENSSDSKGSLSGSKESLNTSKESLDSAKDDPSASKNSSRASSKIEERLLPDSENQFEDASSVASLTELVENFKDSETNFSGVNVSKSLQSKPPRARNALISALEKNSTKGKSVESTEGDIVHHDESRFVVYASSEKPICASKFTFPRLYERSFQSQLSARNRKLKPSLESRELFGEYIYKKEDFPPL